MDDKYTVEIRYANGEAETEYATELTLREMIHECLMRPNIQSFTVTKPV